MGIANFRISFETLRQALSLPEDAEILAIRQDGEFYRGTTVTILVAHPDLPKHTEGDVIVTVCPTLVQRYVLEFKDWGIQ